MTIPRGRRLLVVGTLLVALAAGARGGESAPSPLPNLITPTATIAQTSGPVSATTISDAERLANAEAEVARLKREQSLEQIRTKWWEYGCVGCLGAAAILLIIMGLFI